MNTLIQITDRHLGTGTVQTVNARDLHGFLGVGKDFSTWIKDRIEQYGFVETLDFVLFPDSGENSGRGRPAKEYAITLDMAKELAMVERNQKGKQARQYFIDCERRAKAATIDPMQALSDPATMRGLLLSYSERVMALETVVQEQAEDVKALNLIAKADGSMCITNAAKDLQMRPKDLFQWMQENNWIYKRAGSATYCGYQMRIQQGLLEHKVTTVEKNDGSSKIVEQVLVTAKGLAKLAKDLRSAHAA